MSAIPFLLLIVLYGASLLVFFWPAMRRPVADGRSQVTWAAALGALSALSVALIWLPLRSRPLLSLSLSNWPAAVQLPPFGWHIDEIAWSLTGVLLLLTAAVLLVSLWQPDHSVTWSTLLLSGAGAMALWADSLAGLLWSWALLAVVWAITLYAARLAPAQLLNRFGALLVSLLFIWLAAAGLPHAEVPAGLTMAGWPALVTSWLLLAAAWQVGIFPLSLWRPVDWNMPALHNVMIYAVPALAGVGLLARLAAGSDVGVRYSLPLTALGLLGLLIAIYRAWSYTGQRHRVTTALLLAQGSVILLVATWAEGAAGAAAVIAETRVLILAGGLLFLAAHVPAPVRFPWLPKVGSVVAVAALAGLPLTAGFSGRATLYNAWAADGRFLLLLVGVVLHIPLIMAAIQLVGNDEMSEAGGNSTTTSGWPLLAPLMGVALAVLGLLALPVGWGDVALVSWLAVLLPPAGAAALTFTVDPLPQLRTVLPHLVPGNERWQLVAGHARAGVSAMSTAVAQASLILEGEKGLLWLLILVAIFWLAA